MSSDFAVYNSEQVKTIVGAVPVDSGRGQDEFCTIEKNEDDITEFASADGAGAIAVSHNNFWTVTFTVKQTSKFNAVLSGIHAAGKALPQGVVITPLTVIDSLSNGNLFVTDKAWLKRMPNHAYAREVGDIAWVFGAFNPEVFIAGH